MHNRFYVDDYLDSLDTTEEADHLQNTLTSMLKRGGFHLTKWVIPHKRDSDSIRRNLDLDDTPVERALGVHWELVVTVLSSWSRKWTTSVLSAAY